MERRYQVNEAVQRQVTVEDMSAHNGVPEVVPAGQVEQVFGIQGVEVDPHQIFFEDFEQLLNNDDRAVAELIPLDYRGVVEDGQHVIFVEGHEAVNADDALIMNVPAQAGYQVAVPQQPFPQVILQAQQFHQPHRVVAREQGRLLGIHAGQQGGFVPPNNPRAIDSLNELQRQLQRQLVQLRDNLHPVVHVDVELEWWTDGVSFLAHDIIFNSFGDHQFQFTKENGVSIGNLKHFLCWWVEECSSIIMQEILRRCRAGQAVNAQFFAGLNDTLLGTGVRLLQQLYQGPHAQHQQGVSERGYAMRHLHNLAVASADPRRRVLLEGVMRDLRALADKDFVDIFLHKRRQLYTFLQATLTAFFYIRNDAYITGRHLLANIEDFRRAVTAAGFDQHHAK
jgi:hypothetical protein